MERADEWLLCGVAISVVCLPLAVCEAGRWNDLAPADEWTPLTPVRELPVVTGKPTPPIEDHVVRSPDDRYEAFVVVHVDPQSTWHSLHLTDRVTGCTEQITSGACYRFSELAWTDAATLSVNCAPLHDDCEPIGAGTLGVRIAVKDD